MIILNKDQSTQLLAFKNWYHIDFKLTDLNISIKTKEEVLYGYDTVVFEHMQYTGLEIESVKLKNIISRMLELAEIILEKKDFIKIIIDMSEFTYNDNTYLERLFRSLASSLRNFPIKDQKLKNTIELDYSNVQKFEEIKDNFYQTYDTE